MRRRVVVPELFRELVICGLEAIDGTIFADPIDCPGCGGRTSGYDIREKVFAPLLMNGERREIRVKVKRFECRECGNVSPANAPFYRFAKYGAPVVDFASLISHRMPFRRAEKLLQACQIDLSWGTVRLYSKLPIGPVPHVELFGIPVPVSLLNLSILGAQLGQRSPIIGAEAFAACRPPPAHGTDLSGGRRAE